MSLRSKPLPEPMPSGNKACGRWTYMPGADTICNTPHFFNSIGGAHNELIWGRVSSVSYSKDHPYCHPVPWLVPYQRLGWLYLRQVWVLVNFQHSVDNTLHTLHEPEQINVPIVCLSKLCSKRLGNSILAIIANIDMVFTSISHRK